MFSFDTPDGRRVSDIIGSMDETIAVLQAMGHFVVLALESGEDMKDTAYGTSSIFRTQAEDARAAMAELRNIVFGKSKLSAKADTTGPVDTPIGQNMVMRRHANGDVFMVPVENQNPAPNHPDYAEVIASNRAVTDEIHALRKDKAALRREIIAEQLQYDIDASQIAEAVNLKTETVERVIAQMLASTRQDDDIGKAVNE